MRPDTLLLTLHAVEVTIHRQGDGIGWFGPAGAMTLPLAVAIKVHKPLLLAVLATADDPARDADWETVHDWLTDDTKVFTPPMLSAALAHPSPCGRRGLAGVLRAPLP